MSFKPRKIRKIVKPDAIEVQGIVDIPERRPRKITPIKAYIEYQEAVEAGKKILNLAEITIIKLYESLDYFEDREEEEKETLLKDQDWLIAKTAILRSLSEMCHKFLVDITNLAKNGFLKGDAKDTDIIATKPFQDLIQVTLKILDPYPEVQRKMAEAYRQINFLEKQE